MFIYIFFSLFLPDVDEGAVGGLVEGNVSPSGRSSIRLRRVVRCCHGWRPWVVDGAAAHSRQHVVVHRPGTFAAPLNVHVISSTHSLQRRLFGHHFSFEIWR